MIEKQAWSLPEIESIVALHFTTRDVCFRGQSNTDWKLIPTAYRTIVMHTSATDFDASCVAQIERDTYREFDIAADRQLRGLDSLERLSRAQHHGVPTRLLDWSSNLFVALFFAVSASFDKDCAIWCLDLSKFPFPKELGRQHRGGGYRIENINSYGAGVVASFAQPVSIPIDSAEEAISNQSSTSIPRQGFFVVWKPHRVDERLQSQEGLLSWYHSFHDGDLVWDYSSIIVGMEKAISNDLLLKIIIPCDKKKSLLNDVLRRGITEHYLFSDLDGLGRRLAREHFENIELCVAQNP